MINFLCWNARGASDNATVRTLKSLLKSYQIPLFAVLEPMSKMKKLDSLKFKLHCDFCYNNISNKIWLFSRFDLSLNIIRVEYQLLSFFIDHLMLQGIVLITVVDAKFSKYEILVLWDSLDQINEDYESPSHLIIGDFNIISGDYEKCGGNEPDYMEVDDFNQMIYRNSLLGMGYSGS